MSKTKKSTKTPNTTPIEQNNPAPKKKQPTTLTEFYAEQYQIQLNKLDKEARAELEANLTKPNRIVRDEPVEYENVRVFCKEVIFAAEEEFEKYLAKKQKELEAKAKKKEEKKS